MGIVLLCVLLYAISLKNRRFLAVFAIDYGINVLNVQVYSLDFFPSKKESRNRYHVPKRVPKLSLVPSISGGGGLVVVDY